MSQPAKVLIFDSGVGGLSILTEIRQLMPSVELVFACDNAEFPYGTKSEATLLGRVDRVLKALIRRVEPDVVVVACNTASTLVLPRIRSHFSKPVVGVVPAIKPAAQLSQSKTIGLLATPGTVSRDYTRQLIDDFARHCQVVSVGSAELVALAERHLRGQSICSNALQQIIAPFFDNPELDTIVLACTHFPLLRNELMALAPRKVNWIDSGEAIARRVMSLLPGHNLPTLHSPEGTALFTDRHESIAELITGLSNYGCTDLGFIDI